MSLIPYLNKLRKYCSYQERCIFDVRKKMEPYPVPREGKERIIHVLEQEGFLNEERFAISFAKGKLVSNKWGRIKIRHALHQKRVERKWIDIALDSLNEESYREILSQLANKKYDSLKTDISSYDKRQKTAVYLQSKGFETDLIFKVLNNIDHE